MVAVPLGISSFHRDVAKTPAILLRNMVIEKDPTNEVDQVLRLQRPGLVSYATAGTGPGRGIFQQDGSLSGEWLVVSGQSLYRVTASGASGSIGTIAGHDLCRFAASTTRTIIVADGTAYSYDGSTLSTVNVPEIDGVASPVSDVAYINGYFILTVQDSEHFFWIAPGETDPQPLNFASIENKPDNVVAVAHVYDELWFFGTESIEVWTPTGDLDLPFERVNGRLYEKGCASRDSICALDNTLFWVGMDGIAYRGGDQPVVISDTSLAERIRLNAGGGLRGWTYAMDGHLFYVLRVGAEGTFAVDVSTGNTVSQFSTYERETWRAHLGRQSDPRTVLAIDDTDGRVWKLDPTVSNDGGEPMVREMTGGTAVLGKPQRADNFEIRALAGYAPVSGTASDPTFLLRWSDDYGNLWTSWKEAKLGKQGQYRHRAIWRRLGAMAPPGRVWQVRFTDDTVLRCNYARLNEAFV